MATVSDCSKGNEMSEVWAVIVGIIVLMVIWGYASSKWTEHKNKKTRAQTMPEISDSLKTGINYNVYLSDGRGFKNIQLVGTVENEDDLFSFANWEGMLVLLQSNGKRVFIKKTAVRYIEEI
jgi:hypothetical protein